MSRFKVYQYKIFSIVWAISELSTIISKFFQKKFNEEEYSKIEGQLGKFQPIFKLKTVLISQNIGESISEQSLELKTA